MFVGDIVMRCYAYRAVTSFVLSVMLFWKLGSSLVRERNVSYVVVAGASVNALGDRSVYVKVV
jgi:hypothetical protein